ncbi:MAG TPA: N-acetyl-gamma-glutamyl-phosphate reductase [Candidatus Thermoplasmatota archaeon]|nr:N-acetyl-gamma-glutamyl-phosphate reductase [Candidatus Thermoplasmatota archaeon]
MVTASILGASGYTGGELLRLLLQHPDVEVVGATSQRFAGDALHKAHPNLRGRTQLKFLNRHELPEADVAFTCVPHGEGMKHVPALLERGSRVIDLSADFRLRDAKTFESWYGQPHAAPQWLGKAVYGLPEFHREAIKKARLVSGVGCTATSVNLAVWPLINAGLVTKGPIVADIKIGSSASGLEANLGSIHAERSGTVRLYAPTTHRHVAEIQQELGGANGAGPRIHYSAHAIELVRGILATCHVFLDRTDLTEKDLWKAYRAAYGTEPFVRLVKERTGIHRFPDPKLVAGSNYADVGFELEEGTNRVVAVCAIDNLVKGAAGSAVQSMNLMFNLDETAGLTQLPLHPV